MLDKRILVLIIVLMLSVFLVGCGTCPEIPEYECPDCICPECPDCPDCVCPDIPPCALVGSLSPEDFGWVNRDTGGSGQQIGYATGFGLIDATFTDAKVIVCLYAGNQLLQTNTLNAGHGLTGIQISSPFDVFGTFDYVADGYWVNVRESEYGQTIDATKVVATVTLNNSKVVIAENTNPTDMPMP